MPRTDRLGTTVSLVMLGLALSMLVPLPSRDLTFVVLGSDLALRLSGAVQLGAILTALVCAGVDAIMRTHPRVYHRSLAYTATFWVLPSLLTVTGLILLHDLSWWGYRIGLIGLVGLLLGLVIVFQYRSIDPDNPYYRSSRLALNGTVYLAALILFVALYGLRLRSLISGTAMLLASGALALELLRIGGRPQTGADSTGRTWIYAALTGILMGELTWTLNYHHFNTQMGGAFLLLVFYTLTGLMQQYLWGRVTRRVVIEFASVCAIGLVVLIGFSG